MPQLSGRRQCRTLPEWPAKSTLRGQAVRGGCKLCRLLRFISAEPLLCREVDPAADGRRSCIAYDEEEVPPWWRDVRVRRSREPECPAFALLVDAEPHVALAGIDLVCECARRENRSRGHVLGYRRLELLAVPH